MTNFNTTKLSKVPKVRTLKGVFISLNIFKQIIELRSIKEH